MAVGATMKTTKLNMHTVHPTKITSHIMVFHKKNPGSDHIIIALTVSAIYVRL